MPFIEQVKVQPRIPRRRRLDIVDGGCSGTWDVIKVEKLTKKQCMEELEKQGSDPSFIECMD